MEEAAPLIVLYLPPIRSHLVAMVELAKLLLRHHLSITILLPTPPIPSPDTASYLASASAATPSIRFHHLPPVPLPAEFPPPNDAASHFDLIRLNNANLRRALASFSAAPSALVLDFFCTPAFEVGSDLQIRTYYFYVCGAAPLALLLSIADINRKFPEGLIGVDVHVDVPGLPLLHSKDLPINAIDRSQRSYSYFMEMPKHMAQSEGIIVNTFYSLEPRTIEAIRAGNCVANGPIPTVYCIGPLFNSKGNQTGAGNGDRHAAIRWLDSQPSRSVVVLSFGSMGYAFSPGQMAEIAAALERSSVRFLWVARVPKTADSEKRGGVEAVLPRGFLERTRDHGLVVDTWAPQVEILNHGSVGGFVTHCGWNSILEAVAAGVPMLGWPLYAEQKINRVGLVGIGAALSVTPLENGFVSSVELENQIMELMHSERGKAIRERVVALRNDAVAAMNEGGSSIATLAELALDMKKRKV